MGNFYRLFFYSLSVQFLFLLIINEADGKQCVQNRQFELIINGDFEQGNQFFSSEYDYLPSKMTAHKSYCITKNPKSSYPKFDSCGDHTTGLGNAMLINGDSTGKRYFWGQTVYNLKKNTDYTFSYWITSVDTVNPPAIYIIFNGDTLKNNVFLGPKKSCHWYNMQLIWNSAGNDTVRILLTDFNRRYFGNDFAVDDISLQEVCHVQACTGDDLSTCNNSPVQIKANAQDGISPYYFSWTPQAGLDNPYISNPTVTITSPTTYYLMVTDSKGCIAYDTINVDIHPFPPNNISADKPQPLCSCDSVTISAPVGYNYRWSNGSGKKSITVSQPGVYTVDITDSFGCKSIGSFTVSKLTSNAIIAVGTGYAANIDDTINIPVKIVSATNMYNCGYENFQGKISYNSTLLLPVKATPFGTIANGTETLNLSGNGKDSTIIQLDFMAVLGNSECTDLVLSGFSSICNSVQIDYQQGQFCLLNICKANGKRLINPKLFSFNIENKNSVEIKFIINPIELGHTELGIYNELGENIDNIKLEFNTFEEKEISYNPARLSTGVFFVVFKSESMYETKKLLILR